MKALGLAANIMQPVDILYQNVDENLDDNLAVEAGESSDFEFENEDVLANDRRNQRIDLGQTDSENHGDDLEHGDSSDLEDKTTDLNEKSRSDDKCRKKGVLVSKK